MKILATAVATLLLFATLLSVAVADVAGVTLGWECAADEPCAPAGCSRTWIAASGPD